MASLEQSHPDHHSRQLQSRGSDIKELVLHNEISVDSDDNVKDVAVAPTSQKRIVRFCAIILVPAATGLHATLEATVTSPPYRPS